MRSHLRQIGARLPAHEIGDGRQRGHDGLAGLVFAVQHAQHIFGNPPLAILAQVRFARDARAAFQSFGHPLVLVFFAARVQPHFAIAEAPRAQANRLAARESRHRPAETVVRGTRRRIGGTAVCGRPAAVRIGTSVRCSTTAPRPSPAAPSPAAWRITPAVPSGRRHSRRPPRSKTYISFCTTSVVSPSDRVKTASNSTTGVRSSSNP